MRETRIDGKVMRRILAETTVDTILIAFRLLDRTVT
jgi:hypothetical protein